jgi:hypothetical protein
MPALNLNPPMPDNVQTELERRMGAVANRDSNWMYKKYAYIKMSTTGNSQTMLCPSVMSIGDGTIGHGGHLSLYTEEGGIRKFKPTLTSVKITNEGGQDYTESYIYEIEAQFKVFTLDDLDRVENSFFRVGAEVLFEFGWNGAPVVAGVNQATYDEESGNGGIKANVYNFSFSLEDDGGFACSIKAMSAAALWSQESMGGTTKVDDAEESKKNVRVSSVLESLQLGMRNAFGLKGKQVIDNVTGGISDNTLICNTGKVKITENEFIDGIFWITEMLSNKGTWYNDDELYFSYTNLSTLILYINAKLKKQKSRNEFIWGADPDLKITPNYEIGSADPTKIVLPGEHATYGSGNGTPSTNFKNWSSVTTQNGNDNGTIKEILVGLEYLNRVYLDLESDQTSKKGGVKKKPTVREFLNKIFNDIENLTGGLVSIMMVPETTNQGEQNITTDTDKILIVNRRVIDVSQTIKPFTFPTLSKRAICKSVSLSTDFDSDTLILATKSAVAAGKSNLDSLTKLYPDCATIQQAASDAKKGTDGGLITNDDLITERNSYGDDGFDNEGVQSLSDTYRRYLQQERAKNPTLWPAQFNESLFMFKLSVTIDGIFGIPYLAPITIDRLPTKYSANDKTYFSITSIEHSFDGQGGWETSLDTVMRIQGGS